MIRFVNYSVDITYHVNYGLSARKTAALMYELQAKPYSITRPAHLLF